MSNPWKTAWNVITSIALLATSAWLTIDDYFYPGEILFQTSGGLVWLTLIVFLWLLIAHVFAVLPKRFLFPILILLTARLSVGFPLNLVLENNLACLIVSATTTLIAFIYCLGAIFQFLSINDRPWFKLKHSLIVFLTGIALSIASIPISLGGLVTGTHNFLGDYARFTPTSISLLERVFVKGNQKVFLIGMMHIGEGSFYEQLNDRMATPISGQRIVLTEGVRDSTGILPKAFASGKTYSKWAKRFGLEVQGAKQRKLTKEQQADRDQEWSQRGVQFINADIDVSEMSEQHRTILVQILEALGSDNILEMMVGPEDLTGVDLEDLMMEGLIGFRNQRLMEKFADAIASDVEEIYIPWGAAHLPDIEEQIKNLGFEKINEEKHPVVRFWNR